MTCDNVVPVVTADRTNVPDSRRIAEQIIADYRSRRVYARTSVERLAALASGTDDRAIHASRAIFGDLVEPLADSFDPTGVSLYNRAFGQIVQFCRAGQPEMDRKLLQFDLKTEDELLKRAEGLRSASSRAHLAMADVQGLQLAVVLSRVTLGADVAVTSVLIGRLKERLPTADIVLVGGRKMRELFGGDPRLSFHELEYGRAGSLAERLLSWVELAESVGNLTRGLEPRQYVVIDPDSRLTQLGILPVCPPESYLFFPSREYRYESDDSLSRLASCWGSELLGGEAILPKINPRPDDVALGQRIARRVKSTTDRKLICLNFGVGGNSAKRVGLEFERFLIEWLAGLLPVPGSSSIGPGIILDSGSGGAESELANAVFNLSRDQNSKLNDISVVEACEDSLPALLAQDVPRIDILVWNGRIGLLAGMMASCDLYIGYDSMGQHIAAALGVPCIDVAAGYVLQRFLQRWTPTGRGAVNIISVAEDTDWRGTLDAAIKSAGAVLGFV
ncbi:MAG TPA: hypothetical protein VI756_16540 [Blastocatellia bacterium]